MTTALKRRNDPVFPELRRGFQALRAEGDALRRDHHHLSYPFLIEDGGRDLHAAGSAPRAGKLTLYRARRFPDAWEEAGELLPLPAIDPSVIQWRGRWWMFYALAGADDRPNRELHRSPSPIDLTGPWRPHAAANLARRRAFWDSAGSRTPAARHSYCRRRALSAHAGIAMAAMAARADAAARQTS